MFPYFSGPFMLQGNLSTSLRPRPHMVTLTPSSFQAKTYVNGQRLCETSLLQYGCVIRFGKNACQFRFIDAASEFRTASTALHYERFTG